MSDAYLGNPNLKKVNTPQEFSKKQILEYQKCSNDPIYFMETYIRIVSLDDGLVPFKMYEFQRHIVRTIHDNRFTICKLPRQSGKSTTTVSYLLHYALFNPNSNIAILANKSSTARDILGRVQLAYENLPKWMQQGVINWNKGNIELENKSVIVAAATSSSAIRGGSYNIIFLDEFAFVPANIAEQFFSAVYPTISSGQKTKMIIVSTPYGMNQFYKLWTDAENKRNDYVPIEVHWSEVPGRDEAWKEATIRNTSPEQFQQEFECEFLGSVNTLINPSKIKTLAYIDPIQSNAGLDVYEDPIKGNTYVCTVDVARGVSKDYSAFLILDVTQMPFKIVAKFRNNEIRPLLFPHTIEQVCKAFNHAHVLVETNDLGQQIAEALQFELEYDNLLMTTQRGRAGQILGAGFSGRGSGFGVKMTKQIKKIGCANIKTLIESDKVIIQDFNIIEEMSTFIRKGQSWQADDGANDDLMMCLVIFGWLSNQPFFKEMTDTNARQMLYDEQQHLIEQDMAPFGFVDDGTPDHEKSEVDEYGTVWHPVVHKGS
ncbi:terminase family protein [bacterium]|nr:terminase family protein [bacterium]